jgi:AmiR/NasT family two-component response regulator
MRVAALSAELLFASRVQAALAAVGCAVEVLTGDEAEQLGALAPDLLVLDLALPAPVREAAVAALRGRGRPVIAVGSHVDAASLAWARQAGCAEVLTRGQVARALAPMVAKHLARLA